MELFPRPRRLQRMLADPPTTRSGFLPVENAVFELSEVLLTSRAGNRAPGLCPQSTGPENAGEGLPELALRFET